MRTILLAVFVVAGCLQPARADEQRALVGKTVEGWIEVFRDETRPEFERALAVRALRCFGKDARDAIPDLIAAIRRGQFREEAVAALVEMGASPEVTVPFLIERFLKEGCLHLTAMGSILFYPDVKDTLVRVGGPAVPALLQVLRGPDKGMRVCAAEALGEIGPEARAAIPSLLRAIERHDDEEDHPVLVRHAVQALGRIGPEAKAAVPILKASLFQGEDADFDVVVALDRIGVPPVRELLDAFLLRGDASVAFRLACLGPKAREAVPALRAALTDERRQVRYSAAIALGSIDPTVKEAVPILIEALTHWDDETVDIEGVPRALARFGPEAEAALPSLIELVEKGFAEREILRALVQVDPEGKGCVPALVSTLKHEDYSVVEVAADCLGLLGPRAKEAVPALATVVTRDFREDFSNGHQPQVAAAKALRRIGPAARSVIPDLSRALKYRRIVPRGPIDPPEEHRDDEAAATAALVLGSFGPEAKAAVPALIEAVQTREKDDENASVRAAAMMALGQIGPDARAAIPVLRALLDDKDAQEAGPPEAVIALCRLTPDGRTLAEAWLAEGANLPLQPSRRAFGWSPESGLRDRCRVLGALGRSSFESDWLTRNDLKRLDSTLATSDPRDDVIASLEWRFEELGQLGVAGRLAIPRLREFRKNPDPWVRMWASEAIEKILPPASR